MSLPLVFGAAVEDDVAEAVSFLDGQRPGLGEQLLSLLDEVFDQLRSMAVTHRVVYKDARRALTRKFNYAVFYRLLEDRVEVFAVQHCKRNPAIWQGRI